MSALPFRGPAVRPAEPSRSPYALLAGFGRSLLHVLATPVRFYQARSRLAEVVRLTDHELADIGLTRFDIADVTALPRDQDPTSELARRAESRRRRA